MESPIAKATTGSLDDLLVPGDTFEINEDDFRYIVQSPNMMGNVRSKKLIQCVVLRVYLKSSIEIYYVCKPINYKPSWEFALRWLTEDMFEIGFKGYSAMVLLEARRETGVKPVFANFYTKEDAEKIKAYIESISHLLVENQGFLINPNFSL